MEYRSEGAQLSAHHRAEVTEKGRLEEGRAAARLAKHVEIALAQVGLSSPQYRVLILLGRGSAVASALAANLVVSPPSVTALVDGLVARGLVARRSDAGDRRRVSHVLTHEGQRMLAEADAAVSSRLEEVADFLPSRDRAKAIAALRLWENAMNAYLATKVHRGERATTG
jgi:long-chain acyl-CoA synthetase